MDYISSLPLELFLQIIEYLGLLRDLSSLTRCARHTCWRASQRLFNITFASDGKFQRPELVFQKFTFRAISLDSQRMIQWLVYHKLSGRLNGFVPQLRPKHITYLHLSIIGDAPHVASHLIKLGTDLWEAREGYPDLTPLCLAVAQPHNKTLLDSGLRIASGYSLPRAVEYLLTRGADPNRLSRFGLAAIHLAAMKKVLWRSFRGICYLLNGQDDSSARWESMLNSTLYQLLRYGGDPNLKSAISRMHHCQHACWRSADCSHRGQRVLHFACGSGNEDMVKLLLTNGADPGLYTDDGYLPLFSALSQDYARIAIRLSQDHVEPGHLVIVHSSQSTTLHIACRFALPNVVEFLLERGADPNVTDSHGKTPLHEVVCQNCPDLEDRVIQTLQLLSDYGASPDIESKESVMARDIGTMCLSRRIREMFTITRREDAPIPCNRLRAFKLTEPVSRAPSAGGTPIQQYNNLTEVDGNDPFPSLGKPSTGQGGCAEFNKPQTVWFDKPIIEQLSTSQPSSLGMGYNAARQVPLAGIPLAEKVDRKEKVPEAVKNPQESFIASRSVSFWSSFSPPFHKDSQAAPEFIGETKSPHRKNQKKKKEWIALDIL